MYILDTLRGAFASYLTYKRCLQWRTLILEPPDNDSWTS